MGKGAPWSLNHVGINSFMCLLVSKNNSKQQQQKQSKLCCSAHKTTKCQRVPRNTWESTNPFSHNAFKCWLEPMLTLQLRSRRHVNFAPSDPVWQGKGHALGNKNNSASQWRSTASGIQDSSLAVIWPGLQTQMDETHGFRERSRVCPPSCGSM